MALNLTRKWQTESILQIWLKKANVSLPEVLLNFLKDYSKTEIVFDIEQSRPSIQITNQGYNIKF